MFCELPLAGNAVCFAFFYLIYNCTYANSIFRDFQMKLRFFSLDCNAVSCRARIFPIVCMLILSTLAYGMSETAAESQGIENFFDPVCPDEEYSPLPFEAEFLMQASVSQAKHFMKKLETGIGYLGFRERLISLAEGDAALKAVKFWGEKQGNGVSPSRVDAWYKLPIEKQHGIVDSLPQSLVRQFHNAAVRKYNEDVRAGKLPYSNQIVYEEFQRCSSSVEYFSQTDIEKVNKCMGLGFLTATLINTQNTFLKNKKTNHLIDESVMEDEGSTQGPETIASTFDSPFN